MSQVAEALDHAQLEGVVHRDLEPSSIMLREGGVAYDPEDPRGSAVRSVVSIHLSEAGLATPPSALRPAAGALGDWRHAAVGARVPAGSAAPSDLAAALQRLRQEAEVGRRAMALSSGAPWAQLALVAGIRDAALDPAPLTVLCLRGDDRPFLPAASPGLGLVHGLVLDSPPLAVEAAHWARVFGPGFAARALVVPPEPGGEPSGAAEPSRGEARRALGLENDAFVVAQTSRRSGPSVALAVQAFQIWAHGDYARCEACGALSLDRFDNPMARYEARPACLYCRATRLRRAEPRPRARLVLALLEGGESPPDPRVVADWLGIRGQVRVVEAVNDATPTALLRAADLALALGSPALPDGRWREAREAGLWCVTNDPAAAGDEGALVVATAHYEWDWRRHLTGWTALSPLVRALDAGFSRCAEGRRPEAVSAPRHDAARAWREALERLFEMPARKRRLRVRRWAPRSRP